MPEAVANVIHISGVIQSALPERYSFTPVSLMKYRKNRFLSIHDTCHKVELLSTNQSAVMKRTAIKIPPDNSKYFSFMAQPISFLL